MGIRTGRQFVEHLQNHPREVWVEGERVDDVTTHPAFAESVRQMARLYDMQHDPRFQEQLTYIVPETGERAPASLMPALTLEDLKHRAEAYRISAGATFGLMGRSPHFMHAVTLGFCEARDIFGEQDPRFAENVLNYYRYVRDNDLFLSHALITPQNDRSKNAAQQQEETMHLRIVRETPDGLIVRGARMLATFGPIADELLMYNLISAIREGEEDYTILFAIPTDAKGVRQIARPPYRKDAPNFDHPMATRFEENDSLLIFDDVLIPWERVFSYRNLAVARMVPRRAGTYTGHMTQIRALVKLQFIVGLACAVAQAIKADQFLHVQQMLGELITDIELMKSCIVRAEVECESTPDGTLRCAGPPLAAAGRLMARVYPRAVEVLQTIGAGGLMMQPAGADFTSPELAADVAKYYRGAEGMSSVDRVRLYKIVWDMVGEAFGQRAVQYERYYAGDPVRLLAQAYNTRNDTALTALVEQATQLAGMPDGSAAAPAAAANVPATSA